MLLKYFFLPKGQNWMKQFISLTFAGDNFFEMLQLVFICSALQFIIDFSFVLMYTCTIAGIACMWRVGWRGHALRNPLLVTAWDN